MALYDHRGREFGPRPQVQTCLAPSGNTQPKEGNAPTQSPLLFAVFEPSLASMTSSSSRNFWMDLTDGENVLTARRKLTVPSRTASTTAATFRGSTRSRLTLIASPTLAQGVEIGR